MATGDIPGGPGPVDPKNPTEPPPGKNPPPTKD